MATINYYDVLGVSETADDQEIRESFRRLAKQFHPDRHPGNEAAERRFKEISEAYEALKDPDKRAAYNERRRYFEERDRRYRRLRRQVVVAVLCVVIFIPSAILFWVFILEQIELKPPKKYSTPLISQADEEPSPTDWIKEIRKQPDAEERPQGPAPEAAGPESDRRLVSAPPAESAETETQRPRGAGHAQTPTAAIRPAGSADEAGEAAPKPPAPQTVEWRALRGSRDLVALQAFVNRYEGTDEAEEARARLRSLITRTATADPLRHYLKDARDGSEAALAQQRLDELLAAEARARDRTAWINARARGGNEALMAYLADFPHGTYADEARSQLGNQGLVEVAVGAPGEERIRWLKPGRDKTEFFQDCKGCPIMVVVPAGGFAMGSPDTEAGRSPAEGPQRHMAIARPFAISKYEVTFAEWDACVAEGGCKSYRPDDRGWGRGRRPVINVSWDDAQSYVRWLSGKTGRGYRLPTEAEWEYAARAGSSSSFWWGSWISAQLANYAARRSVPGEGHSVAVDSLTPNPWGLHHVHGNAAEWVADCWRGDYGQEVNGRACAERVVRGGSWESDPTESRSAYRAKANPEARHYLHGFRVARTL